VLLAGEGEEEDEENRLFFGPKLPPIRCADNAVDADEMLYWRESPFSFSFFYCLMSFAVCVTSQLSAYLDCFFEIFFLPSPSRLLKTHYLMHADLFSLALEWLFLLSCCSWKSIHYLCGRKDDERCYHMAHCVWRFLARFSCSMQQIDSRKLRFSDAHDPRFGRS
jgi:hypothetical protein